MGLTKERLSQEATFNRKRSAENENKRTIKLCEQRAFLKEQLVLFAGEFCSKVAFYPLHAEKSFAQVSLSRCMRTVLSDLECL